MDDFQEIYDKNQKRLWDQMKVGREAQEHVQKIIKKNKDYFAMKQAQDYSRLSGTGSQPETVDDIDQEIALGREDYQQKVAARQATAGQPETAHAEATAEEGEEEGEGDYSSGWNRLKAAIAKLRAARGEGAGGGLTTEAAQMAADKALRTFWFTIQEALEIIAAKTMFIASPLVALLLFIRAVGYLSLNFFFTIRIKGVEVKPFPGIHIEDIARAKAIICIVVSFAITVTIIAIATIFTT